MIIPHNNEEGYYNVINGSEITDIRGAERKDFWQFGQYSKDEYEAFVKASQGFFEDYKNGKDCSKCKIGDADALYVYEHCGNCITVQKNADGYSCADDGRHRCAAAKELGLDVLVFVVHGNTK